MPILLQKTLKNNGGFTLIEVLIILVIFAGLAAYTLPKLSTGDQVRSAVRRLAVITKQTQTSARLSGSIYRLVIEMPTDKKEPHKYWVEKTSSKNIKTFMSDETDKEKKKGEETTSSGFEVESKITKGKESLPGGLFFENVEFSEKSIISSGKAYLYFFPQGYVTKAAIHLTNRKKIMWTIVVNPLTGQANVISEFKSLKDLQ